MINGYKIFDADAHVMMSPKMWQDLPKEYEPRRPRPLEIADSAGAGIRRTGWLIEGRMEPHAYGPGAQGANTPTTVMAEFGAVPVHPGLAGYFRTRQTAARSRRSRHRRAVTFPIESLRLHGRRSVFRSRDVSRL